MAEKAVDSRVRRTKRLLKQGLTELMAQKSIKKITVRDVYKRQYFKCGYALYGAYFTPKFSQKPFVLL